MPALAEIKGFSGFMNTDDANSNLPPVHHKYAKNLRFRGNGNNMRAETVEGTTLLNNPYLPSGSNQAIGAFYDDLKQRIFTFNYNSTGLHGIYQYALSTGLWTRILLNGYNTSGDILGFTLNGPIYAVKILVGDTTQGDTLFFNNSTKQPCQVNINFAIAGSYGTVKRSYIDVIKAIPTIPIAATYENDNTFTVNNLRKTLFKFKARYIYSNLNKSLWSSHSVLPLPINYLDALIDKDPTKNCKIALIVPTGEADVVKIEIAAALNGLDVTDGNGNVSPNQFGDFFSIAILDKSLLSIPSNDITTYRFLNDKSYFPVDVTDSIQLYDLVPIFANCLELLNGDVPIYAGITEGYPISTVTATATSTNEAEQTTQPRFIFQVNQSGDSGFGTGNIHAVVLGTITVGDTFNIYTTNQTITFVAAATTTASIITGLAAAAVVDGFTVVSSDTENLYVVKTGEVLLRSLAVPVLISVTDSFVYDRNSRYNYVLVYLDAAGRSIGSLTNTGMSVQTINYIETATVPQIPKLQLSISSRPPIYASYFQIGRTKNLSKLTKLEWVSFLTFKDATYAYIGIENLNTYILDNPSSKFLAYDFSPGDRIRFYKVLSGTVNTIYGASFDFEIQSQVLSPLINGIQQTGQYLKIPLPAITGTFDFGSSAFYNYFIELYTPAKPASAGLDFDYEFGERYAIGNAGTVNAFHQGMLQNQTSNLGTPATFEFTQGDYYYRNRTINGGNGGKWNINQNQVSAAGGHFYPALTLLSSTIDSTNYAIQGTSAFASNTVTSAQNANWALFKNTIGANPSFKIEGSISFRSTVSGALMVFGVELFDGSVTNNRINLGQIANITANTDYTINISTTFAFSPTYNRAYFFIGGFGGINFTGTVTGGTLTINETGKTYTKGIIDPNFSDFFQSAVNSNGRAWVVDPNAAQVYNGAMFRWGLADQVGTNLNNSNRFRPLDFDELNRAYGDIQLLKVREMICRTFQNTRCGQLGIYAKFIQDSAGTTTITTTDDIITKKNVQYYEGAYGVGNCPTGVVSTKIDDYYVFPEGPYHVRLGGDGNILISKLYKGQFYIQPLFVPYNTGFTRLDGSNAKILGAYNYKEEECMVVLQGGSGNLDYTFSFNEKRNGYCTFFDIINPDWLLSVEDNVYFFKNGQMYINDNPDTTFFGTHYDPSITLVYNDKSLLKKTFMALSYQAGGKWVADQDGDILTSTPNPQTGLPQISKLKDFNITLDEGIYTAAFMKDLNSRQDKLSAWYNGDELKGTFLQLKLTYKGTGFSYLYLPDVKWIISPRN